jgi:hypothetical protein
LTFTNDWNSNDYRFQFLKAGQSSEFIQTIPARILNHVFHCQCPQFTEDATAEVLEEFAEAYQVDLMLKNQEGINKRVHIEGTWRKKSNPVRGLRLIRAC